MGRGRTGGKEGKPERGEQAMARRQGKASVTVAYLFQCSMRKTHFNQRHQFITAQSGPSCEVRMVFSISEAPLAPAINQKPFYPIRSQKYFPTISI